MQTDLESTIAKVNALIAQFSGRDRDASALRAVREGDFEALVPGAFSEDYPAPIIANRIDTMARDAVASLTPLPSFNCTPSSSTETKAKEFAAKRTKIARHYLEASNLQAVMPDIADSFNAYGLFAVRVEPDHKNGEPRIRALDGAAVYPVYDKDLRTVEAAQVSWVSRFTLAALYPDKRQQIESSLSATVGATVKVIQYENADLAVAYLPEAGNLVLEHIPNRMGRCTYVCVPRPTGRGGWHSIPRGSYNDLIYPLIAANEFRMMALEATDKAIRAPLAVPPDATDISFGPDATITTNTPQNIRRVELNVPPSVFTATSVLDHDIQVGGMSPGSRSGNINASVITGRGVDALGEGYSQQIALAQTRIGWGLQQAISLCFEMDERLWPQVEREIRGQASDAPFSLKYKPARDIAGDYSVSVDYGFLLGLDANRALVFILQAQAAGLISLDTSSRYLPIQLNVAEEQNKIYLEQLRNSLIQALAGTSQSLPALIAGGQDPSSIISAISSVIAGVKKGKDIENVTSEVFAPPPPPPSAAGPTDPVGGPAGSDAAGGGGQAPAGAPNIATEGPNGRPDLAMLFSGITASGAPNLAATVSRMKPVAGQ